MRALTIDAGRMPAASGLYNALSASQPELSGDDTAGHRITVALNNDARVIALLVDASQAHVTARNDGPARMELEGHRCTFHSR